MVPLFTKLLRYDCAVAFKILFILTLIIINNHMHVIAYLTETDETKLDPSEINELNQEAEINNGTFPLLDVHRDETNLNETDIYDENNIVEDNLKYNVETIEDPAIKREIMEIEERYNEPSLLWNMDELNNIDIEMIPDIYKTPNALDIMLIGLALLVILMFTFTMVFLYRNQFFQQLRSGELLLTTDNQDYWPQQQLIA